MWVRVPPPRLVPPYIKRLIAQKAPHSGLSEIVRNPGLLRPASGRGRDTNNKDSGHSLKTSGGWKVPSFTTTTYREVEESGLPRCIWNAEHVGSNPTSPTRCSRSYENDVAGLM